MNVTLGGFSLAAGIRQAPMSIHQEQFNYSCFANLPFNRQQLFAVSGLPVSSFATAMVLHTGKGEAFQS